LLILNPAATSGLPYLPSSGGTAVETCARRKSAIIGLEASDELLIARVQSGDNEALSLLFRRYARPVRSVGHKILRDGAEADDLLQDVFLYIHRKSALFDISKGSVRSWIIQVAYTQSFLRRRELKSLGFYAYGIMEQPIKCDLANAEEADYDLTVEGLFGKNGWKKIVEDLTADQWETLRLHFFDGYTFAEIAEKLGQTYSNIRNHHYRGLEKFRKHLVEKSPTRR
jgi:RNA polymerase sigma-70 factor (ECF subfamily)